MTIETKEQSKLIQLIREKILRDNMKLDESIKYILELKEEIK